MLEEEQLKNISMMETTPGKGVIRHFSSYTFGI